MLSIFRCSHKDHKNKLKTLILVRIFWHLSIGGSRTGRMSGQCLSPHVCTCLHTSPRFVVMVNVAKKKST